MRKDWKTRFCCCCCCCFFFPSWRQIMPLTTLLRPHSQRPHSQRTWQFVLPAPHSWAQGRSVPPATLLFGGGLRLVLAILCCVQKGHVIFPLYFLGFAALEWVKNLVAGIVLCWPQKTPPALEGGEVPIFPPVKGSGSLVGRCEQEVFLLGQQGSPVHG